MAITRADVLHVAKLARLELGDAEVDRMVDDLGRILGYVAELETVNTENVAPTDYLPHMAAPLRPDEPLDCINRDIALSEAPRHQDGGFSVPGFVDEG